VLILVTREFHSSRLRRRTIQIRNRPSGISRRRDPAGDGDREPQG
jgi:hypothetical protein